MEVRASWSVRTHIACKIETWSSINALLLPSVALHLRCVRFCEQEAWLEQMFRTFIGDRHYHHHSRLVEDVENTTLRDLISLNLDITDLPLAVFTTPEITVCVANCTMADSNAVALADE